MTDVKVAWGTVLACLLVAGLLVPGPASAETPVARIMIVGDSVTQGRAGDYTWRYWLWRTLQTRNKSVDFVGPRTTLAHDATGYARPDFDQDHAARWGALMTAHGWWVSGYPEDLTQDLVSSFHPDVVIDDLGINNLYYGATPDDVIARAASFVADVRTVNPHATVVFGQLTQQWFSDAVGAYNAKLVDLAGSLDQSGARVLVAPVPADYTVADTYDNSHPNAEGEVKIAGQFADALALLPLPDKPAPTPPPAPAYSGAGSLAASGRLRAVRLDFSTPPGATRQAIWRRDRTAGGRWILVAYVAPDRDHYRVHPLRRHHRYAFRIRAYRGSTASLVYSNTARARAR